MREKEVSGHWEDKCSSLEASREELGAVQRLLKIHVKKLGNSRRFSLLLQYDTKEKPGLITSIKPSSAKLFMVNDTS